MIIEGLKGRRVYVSSLSSLAILKPTIGNDAFVHEIERLHRKYGLIVRVGPNEVSTADWRHIRAIYSNPKTVMKDTPPFTMG